MIRFCTEAGTKQPENGPLLLYWSRQQMEADRQVSRSYRIGNAMVTPRITEEGEQEKRRGFQLLVAPVLHPSAFRSTLALSAFQKVKQLLGERTFFLVLFSKTRPQSCQRKAWTPEGLDPEGKGAASLGSGAQKRPPLPGTCGPFLFLTCHTQCPPSSREPGAGPTLRRGDSPARVAAAGRQARRGRDGRTGYAGDGAPRGAALGETPRAAAGVQSARCPLPRA